MKRYFELAGAIVGIIEASILALGSLVLLLAPDSIEVDEQLYDISWIKILFLILLIYSAAMIVLYSILCKNPQKNNVYNPRLGIKITLLILQGVLPIIMINDFVYLLFFSIPFILLLVSVFVKNPVLDEVKTNIDEQLNKLKELKESGVIDEEQYKAAVDKVIEKM